MKKGLCFLLAAGLVGCSSSGSKTTVTKDADYYAKIIEEQDVEPAYEGVYISADYEGITMAYEFSTGDNDDIMLAIGDEDDSALYIIEDSIYLLVDGEWYYLDDNDIMSSLLDSFDLDGMKDDILTLMDFDSEDVEVTNVENGSDSNIVYISNDGDELAYEFDINSDKVLSITREEDDNKATISFTDDDWQTTVLTATEDVEPTELEDFYSALSDFYSEMYS